MTRANEAMMIQIMLAQCIRNNSEIELLNDMGYVGLFCVHKWVVTYFLNSSSNFFTNIKLSYTKGKHISKEVN